MLHYTADPEKDPERDWKEWYEKERSWTPKAKWDKEYEIDFTTTAGKLVYWKEFCDFDESVNYIDSFDVQWELILWLDFWQSNPTAAYVWCYTDEWKLYIIDEYFKPAIPSVSSREMFRKFASYMGQDEYSIDKLSINKKRELADATFQIKVIDPTTAHKNRTSVKDWEEIPYSVREEFFDNWWDFELWINDVNAWITRIREYLKIDDKWESNFYIFKDRCPQLCREFKIYKYKEQSEGQKRTANVSEQVVKKDDHWPDAVRYLAMTRPSTPTKPNKQLTKIQQDIQNILKPKIVWSVWDLDW